MVVFTCSIGSRLRFHNRNRIWSAQSPQFVPDPLLPVIFQVLHSFHSFISRLCKLCDSSCLSNRNWGWRQLWQGWNFIPLQMQIKFTFSLLHLWCKFHTLRVMFSKSVDESESKLESVTSLSKASSSSRGGGGAGTEGAFRVVASPGIISYRDSYTFSVSELLHDPPETHKFEF